MVKMVFFFEGEQGRFFVNRANWSANRWNISPIILCPKMLSPSYTMAKNPATTWAISLSVYGLASSQSPTPLPTIARFRPVTWQTSVCDLAESSHGIPKKSKSSATIRPILGSLVNRAKGMPLRFEATGCPTNSRDKASGRLPVVATQICQDSVVFKRTRVADGLFAGGDVFE